jgi:hypothetical protein
VASYEEIVSQVLSPQQHIEQAERWVNTLPAILADQSSRYVGTTAVDIAIMDVYLHAADVHLKLAEAKQRTRLVSMSDPDAPIEQRLGHPTGHPSSKDYPSQIELLGG